LKHHCFGIFIHNNLNFLIDAGMTLTYDIPNGTFTRLVPVTSLIDEGATASNLSLNGGYVEVPNW